VSEKKKILLQLDGDPRPSVFDRIVALDAGADEVLSYGGITPDAVRDLIYGAIFTRGPEELRRTAVFIGGSDVHRGEELLATARQAFFGPLRVSIMLDPAGANTTAAAAVVVAGRHLKLQGAKALVLGSTGPVGQRLLRLLVRCGAVVLAGSRSSERATRVTDRIASNVAGAQIKPVVVATASDLEAALDGVQLLIAAGGPGVCLVPRDSRLQAKSLRLVVDLNAVPPEGIEGVRGTDAGQTRDGVLAYGAIGVGAVKMKVHKAAVAKMFEANNQILDAEEILVLGAGVA
jgi:hypothetical protein